MNAFIVPLPQLKNLAMAKKNFSNTLFKAYGSSSVRLDIYTAASLGDLEYFIKLSSEKLALEISTPNSSGWTPLMYACSRGHSLLVNYLLGSGAKTGGKTKSGVTPLMLAISSGNLSTVENVYNLADLEKKDYRGWTPLFYAVHFAREKSVDYLLSKGAEVDVVDYQNETPLMVAIKLDRETMVELLLRTTKTLNVVSYKQESALMLAEESKNTKIKCMIKARHEFLKKCRNEKLERKSGTPKKNSKQFSQHCSPTPLRQQIKARLKNIQISKTLTYSPNQKSSPAPKIDLEVFPTWEEVTTRKLWSPQLRPYENVEHFLKTLGLEKYWPIFRDEEVDFETLLTLNEEHLKELGIALFGPRKKIFLAIQQLKNRY